jgi:hypothetical protein
VHNTKNLVTDYVNRTGINCNKNKMKYELTLEPDRDLIIYNDDSLRLKCMLRVNRLLNYQVKWYFNGTEVTNAAIIKPVNSTFVELNILNVDLNTDMGLYKCTVTDADTMGIVDAKQIFVNIISLDAKSKPNDAKYCEKIETKTYKGN